VGEKVSLRISENLRESPRISENLSNLKDIKKNEKNAKTGLEICKVGVSSKFLCEYCNKEFKNKRNINRHLRESCLIISEKKRQILIKKFNKNKKHVNNKSINLFDEQVSNSHNTSNVNTINNTTNINTINIHNQFNFKINPFGQENLDLINENDIIKILEESYSSMQNTIKKIHFDIKENRNIYQPNKKKPYVQVYNGNRWIYKKIDKIGEDLNVIVSNILEGWFTKYHLKINQFKQRVIKNLIEDYNGGKLDNKFNEEFKLFLMNYSDEIKEYISDDVSLEIENKIKQYSLKELDN